MRRPVELYPEDAHLHAREAREARVRQRAIHRARATIVAPSAEVLPTDINTIEIERRGQEYRASTMAQFRATAENLNLILSEATAGDISTVESRETSLPALGSQTPTRHAPEAAARRPTSAHQYSFSATHDRLPRIRSPMNLDEFRRDRDRQEQTSGPRTMDDEMIMYINAQESQLVPLPRPRASPVRNATLTNMLRSSYSTDPARLSPLIDPTRSPRNQRPPHGPSVVVTVTPRLLSTSSSSSGQDLTSSNTLGLIPRSTAASTSPLYLPTSPIYNPTSPVYSPGSPPPTGDTAARTAAFESWYTRQDDATRELVSYADFRYFVSQASIGTGAEAFPARSIRHIRQNSMLRVVMLDGEEEVGSYDLDPTECRSLEAFLEVLIRESDGSEGVDVVLFMQTGVDALVRVGLEIGVDGSEGEWEKGWRGAFERGRRAVVGVGVNLRWRRR